MGARTVRIASPAHLYTPPADGEILQGSVGDWRVYEAVDSDLDPLNRRPGLVRYRVVLEYDAEAAEQALEQYATGRYIAEVLERLWLYVGMTPLSGQYLGSTIRLAAPPAGWQTNYDAVYGQLAARESGRQTPKLEVNTVYWSSPPGWPLANALTGFAAYQTVGPDLHKLVELHYGAHTAAGIHGKALGFARALELLSALLPGHSDSQKEQAVPAHVRECMTQPLAWLYRMSNSRFDTRHVVTGRSQGQVLPPMTPEEYASFIENADVLLRGYVADRLGITFMVARLPAA